MDPNKEKPESNKTPETSTAARTAAATNRITNDAPAAKPDSTQNVLSGEEKEPAAAAAELAGEEIVPGSFKPLRHFVNSRLRNSAGVTLKHGDHDWTVQELTTDGNLRLMKPSLEEEGESNFSLVPFDERYIPEFMRQLLGYEARD